MDKYTKIIDGNLTIKRRSQIVVLRNGLQVINPSDELVLSDGWQLYSEIPLEYNDAQLLGQAKLKLLKEIETYDTSSSVNCFFLNGAPMWLDKATRTGLMLRLNAELQIGQKNTTLWYEGDDYELDIEAALTMLYAIERYASACYDNTQKHLSKVATISSMADVETYNYKDGYPDKLEFTTLQ